MPLVRPLWSVTSVFVFVQADTQRYGAQLRFDGDLIQHTSRDQFPQCGRRLKQLVIPAALPGAGQLAQFVEQRLPPRTSARLPPGC